MRALHPRPSIRGLRRQAGMMLIEALIAILIFSIGILGIIGLQASAVSQSTDAKNRAEAAYLADQLIGQMWAGDRTAAALQAAYNSDTAGAGWTTWYGTVQSVLPGVSNAAGSDTKPLVDVDGNGIVNIRIFWRAPGDDPGADPHQYNVSAQIGQ